jgi:hypothetical protein
MIASSSLIEETMKNLAAVIGQARGTAGPEQMEMSLARLCGPELLVEIEGLAEL